MGSKLSVGNTTKTIKSVIHVDGIKVILDDDSWFLIRPSGTEPKVRFYVETLLRDDLTAIIKTAERLTREALS